MRVLIVESDPELAGVWGRHLERGGCAVTIAASQEDATARLTRDAFEVLVLNLHLDDGSAIAVADFASYRRPDAKIVFVTSSTFFSDGSIFNHIPNACAFLEAHVPPADLAAIVEYHGRKPAAQA